MQMLYIYILDVQHYRSDHLRASLYLNDKWSTETPMTVVVFKAIAPRLDDARANMLTADPYTAWDGTLYRTDSVDISISNLPSICQEARKTAKFIVPMAHVEETM